MTADQPLSIKQIEDLAVTNATYEHVHNTLYKKLGLLGRTADKRYYLLSNPNAVAALAVAALAADLSLPDAMIPYTPEAGDLSEPPERQQVTIYRILRDTALARRIKALHKNECQLCGHTIVLPDDTRYSEAHHIRPIGNPHGGRDEMQNIICVCPNHQAELDYGVRPLSLDELRKVTGHLIGEEYIRYHNEVIHRK